MANITNELEKIKNAVYGNEVRQSIHDGINSINEEVKSTTSRQVDLESTFDQLVINAGNSNTEIVDARVEVGGTSYAKLGDRLNKFDEQFNTIETLENFEIRSNKRNIQPLIVFTIDDGGIHDYQTLLPIFNKYGFVASSGIITGQVSNSNFKYTMTWEQIKELQDVHNWEIVSHATRDVNLTTLTENEIEEELKVAKNTLIEKGFNCRNFFLPQGQYNNTIKTLARKYYRSVRVSGGASSGAIANISPFDMYSVDSRFFGDSTGIGTSIDELSGQYNDTVEYFKFYIDKTIELNGVLCIGMHSNAISQNNRANDLDLICQYIQSRGIEVVTYNEMLNRVGNIIDTQDFKLGASGKIGGLYGKIKVGGFNEILNDTPISEIDYGYVNVSTVGNGNGVGLPLDTGGTMVTIKPDRDNNRAFELFKPYGKDRGLYIRDFDNDSVNEWQKIDNVYTHKLNALSSSHTMHDLKANRINYCTIQASSATGYPENSAGLLIANFNATINTMVYEEYHINSSNKIYDRYWNGSSWSSWVVRNFDDNLKSRFNQSYTLPNIVLDRVTGLTGGYIKIENMVYVNVKFTSAITGNGVLPLGSFPSSTVSRIPQVALNAINVTDGATTYAVLQITSGQLSANLTTGKEYVISGTYSIV